MNQIKRLLGLVLVSLFYSIHGICQVPVAPNSPATNIDKNWVLNKAYDALGVVIGESKTFFDTRGRMLQAQARNLTYNHVLASQVVFDEYGRPALSTLNAPINNQAFSYKSDFMRKDASTNYDYRHFDDGVAGTINLPLPVYDNGVGSLGWYYGNSNTWEKFQATTQYPYHRSDFYKDGTGGGKRSAGPGDYHRMGLGKDVISYATPVVNELDYYLQVRNQYFPSSVVGSSPTTLKYEAIQHIVRDADGKESVTIVDKSGNIVMAARPAMGGLLISNSVILKGYPFVHEYPVTGYRIENIKVTSTGIGRVYANSVLIYTGNLAGYTYTAANITQFKVESDKLFSIKYDEFYLTTPIKSISTNCTSLNETSVYYFKIMDGSAGVTISGTNYVLVDMQTEQSTSLLGSGMSTYLDPGYYKLTALQTDITLTYSNSYTDISYNFYNQLNQLIASIAPEGVSRLRTNGFGTYPTKVDIPFIVLNNYNLKGLLINALDADRKKTEYIYRKDGKIRFSQDPVQLTLNRFSFTNYDKWGRALVTGEFEPGVGNAFTFNSSSMLAALENATDDGGFLSSGGSIINWTRSIYDIPDNSHGISGYTQNEFYLRGAVSMTQSGGPSTGLIKASNRTWYNYDDQGRLIWMIQSVGKVGLKTIDYTYDASGRTLTTAYQKNSSLETFIHGYVYDADQRIKKVYTSTTNTTFDPLNPNISWTLQAEYYYYLTGELKRVELANKLQGVDYVYTIQGWLKTINHSDKAKDPGNDSPGTTSTQLDAFGMTLEYFSGDYTKTGSNIASINPTGTSVASYYGGTVRSMTWFSKKPTSSGLNDYPNMYTFSYDAKYQIVQPYWYNSSTSAGTYTEQVNTYKENIGAYDANGNIKSMVRLGNPGTFGDYNDNLTYNYFINGTQGATANYVNNKLHSITGTGYSSNYQYNDLGQVTREQQGAGSFKYIKYDVLGKVTGVYSDVSMTMPIVEFAYDERGHRRTKTSYGGGGTVTTTSYVCDVNGKLLAIYSRIGSGTETLIEQPVYGTGKIGTYYPQTFAYHYELTDHLGNVRAVIKKNTSLPGWVEYIQYTDYYPFGLVLRSAGPGYRYGFQGQFSEKDLETGWNAFDLRMYDSRIGRWLGYDPAGEFYSPYVGMGNEPISKTDPDGGRTDDWYATRNADGSILTFFEKGRHENIIEYDGKVWYNVMRIDDDTDKGELAFSNAVIFFRMMNSSILINSISSCHTTNASIMNEYLESLAPGQVMGSRPKWMEVVFQLKDRYIEDPNPPAWAETNMRYVDHNGFPTNFYKPKFEILAGTPPAVGIFKGGNILSLTQRAGALSKSLGRNSVNIRMTGNRFMRYDLAGRAHGTIPTPHKVYFQWNVGPSGLGKHSQTVSEMTEADLRIIRNYLKSLK